MIFDNWSPIMLVGSDSLCWGRSGGIYEHVLNERCVFLSGIHAPRRAHGSSNLTPD